MPTAPLHFPSLFRDYGSYCPCSEPLDASTLSPTVSCSHRAPPPYPLPLNPLSRSVSRVVHHALSPLPTATTYQLHFFASRSQRIPRPPPRTTWLQAPRHVNHYLICVSFVTAMCALHCLQTACERHPLPYRSYHHRDRLCLTDRLLHFRGLCWYLFRSTLEPTERVLHYMKISKTRIHRIVLISGSTCIPCR